MECKKVSRFCPADGPSQQQHAKTSVSDSDARADDHLICIALHCLFRHTNSTPKSKSQYSYRWTSKYTNINDKPLFYRRYKICILSACPGSPGSAGQTVVWSLRATRTKPQPRATAFICSLAVQTSRKGSWGLLDAIECLKRTEICDYMKLWRNFHLWCRIKPVYRLEIVRILSWEFLSCTATSKTWFRAVL